MTGRPAQVRILEAAVTAFAASGYAGTSLRAIASEADCDVALIPYYFGSKANLFKECTGVVIAEAAQIPSVAQLGKDAAAHDITEAIVERFFDEHSVNMISLVIRSAAGSETTPPDVREYLGDLLQDFYDDAVGVQGMRDARLPNYLFACTMLGAYILRTVVGVPALANLSTEELVEALAPELQEVIERDLREGFISLP